MLRARNAILALVPALAIGYIGCAGGDTGDDLSATVDEGSAAIVAEPQIVGTFRDEQAAGGIAVLTLKTDYTYHMEDAILCVRYPCDRPETNGQYRQALRGGVSYLLLQDPNGRPIKQLMYKLNGDTLSVAPIGTEGQWQGLARSTDRPWCAEPPDCALQDLPVGICAGVWSCETNVCNYECHPLQTDALRGPDCSGGGCDTDPLSE